MPEVDGFDTEDLRVLAVVVRAGSFTAAARALHYTQSGVSRRVALLERAAGTRLFVRGARGVGLTPAGRALHEHAVDILERLDAAAQEVRAIRDGSGGRLRVGSFATANAALVPGVLRRFRNDRPKVRTTVREALSRTLLEDLRGGRLDLAMVSDYPLGMPGYDDLQTRPLGEEALLVALPAGHPLAHHPALRLRDLAADSWVEAGPHGVGAGTVLAAACARAGFTPRAEIDAPSWSAKLGFVAAGLGVTLIPEIAAPAVPPQIVLRPLPQDLPSRRISAALPAGEPLPAAEHLVTLLEHALAGAPRFDA